jgi:hypothetical protein
MAPSSRTCVPWGFGRLRMLQWMWAPDKGVPQSPQLQDVCEWVVGVSVAGFMFVNYCKLLMVSSQGRAGLQASCPKLPKQNYVFSLCPYSNSFMNLDCRRSMEIMDDPILQDMASPLGFLLALRNTLRLKPGGLLFGGVPCNTQFGTYTILVFLFCF